MEPNEFVSMVHSLAGVAQTLSEGQVDDCHRLSDIICNYSQLKWERLIVSNPDAPSLSVYMADGWSADVASYVTDKVGSTLVRRRGKLRHEFLLQRGLLNILTGDGRMVFAVKFSEPIGMARGRKAWNFFTAGCEFSSLSRHLGSTGIAISIYLFDGALHGPLRKHFTARHEMYYSEDYGVETGPFRVELAACDWAIGIKCISHGCSNAVNWGLKWHFATVTRENVHISIESLQNSRTALHAHIGDLLTRHLKFVHGRTSSDSDILAFWLALDVGPDMCETLVSLDLNWDGDHLCVHDSWERHPKVFEDVAGCLLYLLRWLSFSETRWAKVGRSGRWFIRALAAGIEPLLQICLEDENISHYNMGGFTRATVDVREFLAVASFSALSAESVLLQIFEDDRMLLHADHWWELAIDEVRYVVNLPAYVWGRIARLIGAGCVPLKLQHLAQGASFTTIAYLYWDVFRPCEQLPFSLARGDILANLDAFERDPPRALDPVSAKIKVLLSIGFSRERIRRGLLLMREVPFTTDLVEQGHASAALFSKNHETLGEASLCSRSVCHQSRQVFGPSRTDKVRDRITAAIARLDRRVPSRASAKMLL